MRQLWKRRIVIGLICLTIPAGGTTFAGKERLLESQFDGKYGVLVMAHGGTEAWNLAIEEAVESLSSEVPVEIAFGMASAFSLQDAVQRLEARGVTQIGVVRLFVSGESWLERTRQILGLTPGAPDRSSVVTSGHGDHGGHGSGHHDFVATFWRIETEARFAVAVGGLSEAEEMSQVLLDRARALSVDPARESVLFLAHGPGDDAENERWIAAIDRLAEPVRKELPFRSVAVRTLREDWAAKREVAEQGIRSFVEEANANDGRCIVIPFRVFGFGPYAGVLDGLEHVSDGRGLLPHEAVGDWIRRQSEELAHGPFEAPLSGEPSARSR